MNIPVSYLIIILPTVFSVLMVGGAHLIFTKFWERKQWNDNIRSLCIPLYFVICLYGTAFLTVLILHKFNYIVPVQ